MRKFWVLALSFLAFALAAPLSRGDNSAPPVTLTDNGRSWTLDNGIVQVTIDKDSGLLTSLVYRGYDTGSHGIWEHTPQGAPELTNSVTIDPKSNNGQRAEVSIQGVGGGTYMFSAHAPGGGTLCDIELRYALGRGDHGVYTYAIDSHPASYPAAGMGAEDRFIDEMSRKFDWITVDKDRNMLEASPADWGAGVVVHAKEQRIMSTGNYKNSVEHKYSYSGVQYRTPAYGWSSTSDHVGVWFINPSDEYLSGGPFRLDLDAHLGANDNPPPIILDYWHSGHYDGTRVSIAAGQQWTKVIGPIFVYVNRLDHPEPTTQAELNTLGRTAGNPTVPRSWRANADALWNDALAQAKKQQADWPYPWVNGVDYPHLADRGTVTGRIVVDDPLAPKGTGKSLPNLLVGLTVPDADPAEVARMNTERTQMFERFMKEHPEFAQRYAGHGGHFRIPPPNADEGSWIHNAGYYQFFVDGNPDGAFTIPKVRPGTYTLHAYADGVLGEFAQTNVIVEPGKTMNLGKLVWKPVRYGRQIWQIGYPDRTAHEFFKGDSSDSWLWGWNLRYALLFPNDITYTMGKSDPAKDWFFEEVPHATNLSFVNPAAKDPANQRFGWVKAESLAEYPQTNERGPWAVYGQGRETVWTVKFTMKQQPHGVAALRVGLDGVDGLRDGLPIAVNGKSVGALGDGLNPGNPHLIQTNAIRYNTDHGLWQERTLMFDAALLKPGENTMTFTVPAGDLQSGVVWDYLRLELDPNANLATLAPSRAAQ
ncbi:MAG TPA: polysaccharide lyase family protein [Acidobacteriaceae bacterium]|jgi:rhamnogalacturonan endolyase|nr:polysaccharide lyase family protein [Acidobacteriaceae bacterium]